MMETPTPTPIVQVFDEMHHQLLNELSQPEFDVLVNILKIPNNMSVDSMSLKIVLSNSINSIPLQNNKSITPNGNLNSAVNFNEQITLRPLTDDQLWYYKRDPEKKRITQYINTIDYQIQQVKELVEKANAKLPCPQITKQEVEDIEYKYHVVRKYIDDEHKKILDKLREILKLQEDVKQADELINKAKGFTKNPPQHSEDAKIVFEDYYRNLERLLSFEKIANLTQFEEIEQIDYEIQQKTKEILTQVKRLKRHKGFFNFGLKKCAN